MVDTTVDDLIGDGIDPNVLSGILGADEEVQELPPPKKRGRPPKEKVDNGTSAVSAIQPTPTQVDNGPNVVTAISAQSPLGEWPTLQEMMTEIVKLRGELELLKKGPHTVNIDKEQFVADIVARFKQQFEGTGKHVWYIHDTRDKDKPPIKFRSDHENARQAYRDHQERSGSRYTGQGNDPFVCSPNAVLETK